MSVSIAITQSKCFNKLFHFFARKTSIFAKCTKLHIAHNHGNKSFSYNFRMICRRMLISKDSTFCRLIVQGKIKCKTTDCACKYKLSYNFIQTFCLNFPSINGLLFRFFSQFFLHSKRVRFIFVEKRNRNTLKLKRKCPKDEWESFFLRCDWSYV